MHSQTDNFTVLSSKPITCEGESFLCVSSQNLMRGLHKKISPRYPTGICMQTHGETMMSRDARKEPDPPALIEVALHKLKGSGCPYWRIPSYHESLELTNSDLESTDGIGRFLNVRSLYLQENRMRLLSLFYPVLRYHRVE